MQSIKISLFGNFGNLNIGNEATLQAFVYNAVKYVPLSEMRCVCSNPADVLARHKIAAIDMAQRNSAGDLSSGRRGSGAMRTLRVLLFVLPDALQEYMRVWRALRGTSCLYVIGTGVLTDRGEGLFGVPYQIFKWVLVAKILNIKVNFVSVGVEPISKTLTKWFIRASLFMADRISYRDQQSKQHMSAIGINSSSVVCPDLAFSLPESLLGSCYKQHPHTSSVVGLGLFDYCATNLASGTNNHRYATYLQKMTVFIGWLLKRSFKVRILIGDLKYDNAVRRDLRAKLKTIGINYEDMKIIDEPIYGVEDLLNQIASTDLIVATRFHNVLLSLMLNRPVISISYDPKNDSLMELFGLQEYCQSIDDFDVDRLIEQLAELHSNEHELRQKIRRKSEQCRIAALQQYDDILRDDTRVHLA